MKTTTISDRDAFELAHGRVPARPDLDSLADLLAAYRSVALGSTPRPSAALNARLDLSTTPIAMQRDAVAEGRSSGVAKRAASGLLGVGVVAAIILGAASGAAAVVGAGSAGLLPQGAQEAFDQVVSVVAPPGVAGQDTTDHGEAPGDSTGTTTTDDSTDNSAVTGQEVEGSDDSTTTTGEQPSDNEGQGNSGNGNSGNGNSGAGNSGKGSTTSGESGGSTDTSPGNSGSSNSGQGNSGNGNGNGNSGDKGKHD